jgi:hypothetical protein
MEIEINRDELLKFIAEAHRNTYAAAKEIRAKHRCETPILPGHKDYQYQIGDWGYHDSYAGSIWAPGREVVYFKGNPVWCMSYQGKSNPHYPEDFFKNQVFPFLKEALKKIDNSILFRGPRNFEDGDFMYSFEINGDYTYFKGREAIRFRGLEIFFQDVMGELIK